MAAPPPARRTCLPAAPPSRRPVCPLLSRRVNASPAEPRRLSLAAVSGRSEGATAAPSHTPLAPSSASAARQCAMKRESKMATLCASLRPARRMTLHEFTRAAYCTLCVPGVGWAPSSGGTTGDGRVTGRESSETTRTARRARRDGCAALEPEAAILSDAEPLRLLSATVSQHTHICHAATARWGALSRNKTQQKTES